LGAIKNAAYFLRMTMETPDPDIQESLGILLAEVDRSTRIIQSLLDYARTEQPSRQDVDVNRVLRRTLSRIPVPEGIDLVCHLDEDLAMIPADPGQLDQVFTNLIQNAIQAMPDGGRLTVETSGTCGRYAEGGEVAVSITDTGVGIPAENMAQLFEPLFTTRVRGIGLGLSLVHTLVEGHGGSIDVTSEVGEGSIFTIRLPVVGDHRVAAEPAGEDDFEGQ
jgi:signal transduction histidine kinase